MRRSNYIYPHPNPTARLALAVAAVEAVVELATVEDHLEEVPC